MGDVIQKEMQEPILDLLTLIELNWIEEGVFKGYVRRLPRHYNNDPCVRV